VNSKVARIATGLIAPLVFTIIAFIVVGVVSFGSPPSVASLRFVAIRGAVWGIIGSGLYAWIAAAAKPPVWRLMIGALIWSAITGYWFMASINAIG
jgi:hypothetical protein